jgi:hypothetical protein
MIIEFSYFRELLPQEATKSHQSESKGLQVTNVYKNLLKETKDKQNGLKLNSNRNIYSSSEYQHSSASKIHLPPLPKTEATFTDRQRRTQILQKQRLKK